MSALENWLHYKVFDEPAKRKIRKRHFPRKGPARNMRYRAWIGSLPSCVSGLMGCEPAHTGEDGGMRQKASDYSCVPLTPDEHREYHQIGKEEFAAKYGVSFEATVRTLNLAWKKYAGLVK